jgi:hypothetical protein
MRIDLNYVELHSGLFLNGTNFGTKLYGQSSKYKNKSNAQLEIWYETEIEHTFVVWGEHVAMIESTASKTVEDTKQLEKFIVLKNPTHGLLNKKSDATDSVSSLPHNKVQAQVSGPGQGLHRTAQVETPQSKVQGTPGRKAKYQGEVVE